MIYLFRYRRKPWLPYKAIKVTGHRFDDAQNKMVLYFADGSVEEISNWKRCEVKLGIDWVLAVKKGMEKEIGQPVQLNV